MNLLGQILLSLALLQTPGGAPSGNPPAGQKPSLNNATPQQIAKAKQLAEKFNKAMAHQQAGRINEAATLYEQIVKEAPFAYPAWMNLGLMEQSKGNAAGAERAYREAMKIEPKNALPPAQLALLFLAQRKLEQATPMAKRAAALDAKSAPARVALGAVYAAQGKYKLAEPELKAAIALSPENAQSHFQLAGIYAQTKRNDQALALVSRAVQLDPYLAPAFLLQGTLFHARGSHRMAIASYQKAAKLMGRVPLPEFNIGVAYENLFALEKTNRLRDEAISAYLRCLAIDPKHQGARTNAARLYRSIGNLPQATEHFRIALANDPKNLSLMADLGICESLLAGTLTDPKAKAELHESADRRLKAAQDKTGDPLIFAARARIFEQQGKVNEAAEVYGAWALKQRSDVEPLMGLARCREAQKRLPDAVDLYEQAITLKPALADGYLALAKLHEGQAQLDLAEKTYQRLIKAAPKNADAQKGLGALYIRQGRTMDAVATYQALKLINPKDPAAYLSAANAYERGQKLPEALKEYEALSKLNPKDVSVRLQAARIMEALKQYDQAIAVYRDIEKLAPKQILYASNIARLLDAQGKSAEALEEYRRIYLQDPKNPTIRGMWAAALEKAGKPLEAIREYELILEGNKAANWVWFKIAGIYQSLKRWDDARAAYMRVVDSATDALEAYNNLELLYEAENRPDAWYAFLRAQVERNPSLLIALTKIEVAAVKQKKLADLLGMLAVLSTKNETNRSFQLSYAALLNRHYKVDEAIGVYKKLASSAPDDLGIRETILQMLDKAGKSSETDAVLEEIVKIKAVPPVLAASYRVRLAQSYERANRITDAKALYEQAVKLDPKNMLAEQSIKRLSANP